MVDSVNLDLTDNRRTQYPEYVRPIGHLGETPPKLNHIDFSTLNNCLAWTWYFIEAHQEAPYRGSNNSYLADRVLDNDLDTAVMTCNSVNMIRRLHQVLRLLGQHPL